MQSLAAGTHGPSPVILVVFGVAGLVALGCGLCWAFDVRGITTRRSERIRRKREEAWAAVGRLGGGGVPMLSGSVGYLRALGAVMVAAGTVLLLAAYALWHLG
ncbi:hypothetical protein [Streptomyces griseosporeus]|uniref:hypothetical protein n=1 Tax=Streptomyces griseosporeus TaxID=1910 RepID=UPI0036F72699